MKLWSNIFVVASVVTMTGSIAIAASASQGAIYGTVKKIDSATKTLVIKTAEGTEHTLHFAGKTTVHGTAVVGKDSWKGLKEGSEVVAHYSSKGTEETALEIDNVGKGGLKAMEGTVSRVDKGAKTVVVKGVDGAEQTFKTTDHSLTTVGEGVAAGTGKSAKVTVYYTEDAGKKIAHFFRHG